MNINEDMLCPVCQAKLFTDEVAFCPECGAPHHKKCFLGLGHCFYADKHGTSEQWQPPKIEPPKATNTDNSNVNQNTVDNGGYNTNGFGVFNGFCIKLAGFRSDIERFFIRGNRIYIVDKRIHLRVYGIGKLVGSYYVEREIEFLSELLRFIYHFQTIVHLFGIHQRFAYLVPFRFKECIRHSAADYKRVAFFEKVIYYVKLIRNFRAAENSDERAYGVL